MTARGGWWVLVAAAGAAAAQDTGALFRTDVRLVEVYATVLDHKGRYLDGLTRERFEVKDEGAPQPLAAFETEATGLWCAILMDTTGSMAHALPAVKNAILRMIDQFREGDSVAVYSFSNALTAAQEFTAERAAAKRAVLATRASGQTALFDSLAQLARELSRRTGKKAIVAFTDGQDNVSLLNAGSAIARVKQAGVPVYAVAQGEAMRNAELLRELKQIAAETGGRAYRITKANEIGTVFQDIVNELKHTYLLAYKPPPADHRSWRRIQVSVKGLQNYKVRAREGYGPE